MNKTDDKGKAKRSEWGLSSIFSLAEQTLQPQDPESLSKIYWLILTWFWDCLWLYLFRQFLSVLFLGFLWPPWGPCHLKSWIHVQAYFILLYFIWSCSFLFYLMIFVICLIHLCCEFLFYSYCFLSSYFLTHILKCFKINCHYCDRLLALSVHFNQQSPCLFFRYIFEYTYAVVQLYIFQ